MPANISDYNVQKWYTEFSAEKREIEMKERQEQRKEKEPENIDKFMSLKKWGKKPIDFPSVPSPTKLNSCLVYCVWSDPRYVDYLYLSLCSAYACTDIARMNIYLFISIDVLEQCKDLITQLPVRIVVKKDKFNKYTVLSDERLKKYKNIVICDCDTFFFGGYDNVFEKMFYNSTDVLMIRETNAAVQVFEDRLVLSSLDDLEKYYSIFANACHMSRHSFNDMLEDKKWHLSCLMTIPKIALNDDWNSHVSSIVDAETWCDETVFLSYFWSRGVKVRDLSVAGLNIVMSNQSQKHFEKNNNFGVLHPLHGKWCENDYIPQLFDSIVDMEPADVADNDNYCLIGMSRSGNNGFMSWLSNGIEENLLVAPVKDFIERVNITKSINSSFDKSKLIYWAENRDRFELDIDVAKIILILRDPFNAFTSILYHPRLQNDIILATEKYVHLWKTYAREFIGETNYFNFDHKVNYNKWVGDSKYKEGLAEDLGFKNFDGESEIIDCYFDTQDYLTRYKKLTHPKIIKALQDEELNELSDTIFGITASCLGRE